MARSYKVMLVLAYIIAGSVSAGYHNKIWTERACAVEYGFGCRVGYGFEGLITIPLWPLMVAAEFGRSMAVSEGSDGA